MLKKSHSLSRPSTSFRNSSVPNTWIPTQESLQSLNKTYKISNPIISIIKIQQKHSHDQGHFQVFLQNSLQPHGLQLQLGSNTDLTGELKSRRDRIIQIPQIITVERTSGMKPRLTLFLKERGKPLCSKSSSSQS